MVEVLKPCGNTMKALVFLEEVPSSIRTLLENSSTHLEPSLS